MDPPSPYAADALSFVKKVASGQNIQRAALSTVGNFIMNKIERQTGPIISKARTGFSRVPSMLPGGPAAQAAFDAAATIAKAKRIQDAALARARYRRRLTFPGRYRELSEIDLGAQGAQLAKWVRRGDYVIVLGV